MQKLTFYLKHPKFILLSIMRYVLRVFDYLIPKDNKLILFGFVESGYYGNCKSLFEYALTNSNFKPMSYTNEKKLHNRIINQHGPNSSLYLFSFRFLWYFIRSKTVVTQFGKWELYTLISKWSNKKIVNLWHGTSIKKLGYVFEDTKSDDLTFIPPKFDPLPFDLMPVSSRIEAHTMRDIFRGSAKKIIVTGSARNDDLIKKSQLSHKEQMKTISEKLQLDYIPNHIILYAPTYRNYEAESLWFTSDEFELLKLWCTKHNALFIFRLHRHYIDEIPTLEEDEHFILLGSDLLLDIQEILSFVTLLITDYSGIYFDYLLLNRPIIFFPYDLEQYEKEIGFLYPYQTFACGYKGYTWLEIIDEIILYFKNEDNFQLQRKVIYELMQEQRQPIARKLILQEIEKMVDTT